jgi:hypothetical protein
MTVDAATDVAALVIAILVEAVMILVAAVVVVLTAVNDRFYSLIYDHNHRYNSKVVETLWVLRLDNRHTHDTLCLKVSFDVILTGKGVYHLCSRVLHTVLLCIS